MSMILWVGGIQAKPLVLCNLNIVVYISIQFMTTLPVRKEPSQLLTFRSVYTGVSGEKIVLLSRPILEEGIHVCSAILILYLCRISLVWWNHGYPSMRMIG